MGLLLYTDDENRTDLESKELDAVHVAAEGVIIHALDPLRVQHRVLARRQAHVLHERALKLLDGGGFGALGHEAGLGGGGDGGCAHRAGPEGDPGAFDGGKRGRGQAHRRRGVECHYEEEQRRLETRKTERSGG